MNTKTPHSKLGFTLIEMMISIALGIIVIMGIGQIFVATRTAYSAQQGLSGMQQTGRFAMNYVGNAVRNGGDMGFNNFSSMMGDKLVPSDTKTNITATSSDAVFQITNYAIAGPAVTEAVRAVSGINAYEYVGSGVGGNILLTQPLQLGAGSTEWSPPLPLFIANKAAKGSDVIITRYVAPRTGAARKQNLVAAGLDKVCTSAGVFIGFNQNLVNTSAGIIIDTRPQRMYALLDLEKITLFQALNTATDGTLALRSNSGTGFPGNVPNACGVLNDTSDAGMRIGEFNIEVYYVGVSPTTNESGLWRLNFDGSGTTGFAAEELVEGVESMQIRLGLTLPVAGPRPSISSTTTDRLVTADALANPLTGLGLVGETTNVASRRITSVRLSLLMRSEAGAAGQQVSGSYVVGGTNVTPATDRRLRQIYEESIAVRNRHRLHPGLISFY